MTISEAIVGVDSRKRNVIAEEVKIGWLSELDGRVYNDLIATHQGGESIAPPEYTENTVRETVLLIPHPYDKIYVLWLEAQIDFAGGDTARYLNSYAMFNSVYTDFSRWYHRNHMPKGTKLKLF